MLELMLAGAGPEALVFEQPGEIITLGAIVAEEFFDRTASVISLHPDDLRQSPGWNGQVVYILEDCVSLHEMPRTSVGGTSAADSVQGQPIVQLSDFDRAALEGAYVEATRVSMKISSNGANDGSHRTH